jgi:hypothetical protein
MASIMQSKATTVQQYLAELPADRRAQLNAVRAVIKKNIDKGFKEGVGYGMIGWSVPHSIYPPGYHCDPKTPLPFAGMAAQKNHLSLYIMCVYFEGGEHDWLRQQFAKAGKKLDMGKSCIRFQKAEDLHLEAIGQVFKRTTVKKYVEMYEKSLSLHSGKSKGKGKSAKSAGAASKKSAKTAPKKSSQKAASAAPKRKAVASKGR